MLYLFMMPLVMLQFFTINAEKVAAGEIQTAAHIWDGSEWGWLVMVAFNCVLAYSLLGLEDMAVEIQNPFGYDSSDLPLGKYCIELYHLLVGITHVHYGMFEGFTSQELAIPSFTEELQMGLDTTEDQLRSRALSARQGYSPAMGSNTSLRVPSPGSSPV